MSNLGIQIIEALIDVLPFYGLPSNKIISLVEKAFSAADKNESKDVNEIAENIDEVTEKLNDSKAIIDRTLVEMERQKVLLNELKEKAQTNEALAKMNQDSVDAIKEVLRREIAENEKANAKKNLAWSLFFSILGAVIGFALGKFFG